MQLTMNDNNEWFQQWQLWNDSSLSFVSVLNSVSVSVHNNVLPDIDDIIASFLQICYWVLVIDALEALRVPDFTMNRMIKTDYINILDPMLIQGDNIINLLSAIYLEMLSV